MPVNTEVSTVPDSRHRASLTDGTVVVIRRLDPDDRDAVAALHTGMPAGDRYLRFFTMSQAGGGKLADLVVSRASVAVGAFRDGALLGIAHYYRERGEQIPEVAVAIAHGVQHNGIASLLLEHLLAAARKEGVARLAASVLGINHAMLAVLRDLGVPMRATGAAFDVREIVLRLPADGTSVESEHYIDAVLDRTVRSDVAGLRSLLAPRSIVIVGSGHGPESVDQLILRHLSTADSPERSTSSARRPRPSPVSSCTGGSKICPTTSTSACCAARRRACPTPPSGAAHVASADCW